MRGVVRSLVLIAAVVAGSWISLHRPAPIASTPAPAPTPVATAPAPDPAEPPQPPPEEEEAKEEAWPKLNPEANITKAWRLAQGPRRKPGNKRRLVTLTFDDGPFPETTPKVLDLLEKYDVHATFFVIGRYLDGESERAQQSRDVLKMVAAKGHLVGNHTHDHSLLTTLPHAQVLEQIDKGAASIENAIGQKPVLFRPPFGELDRFGQNAARERGLDILLWSAEVRDMEREDTQTMYRELIRQLSSNDGGVVLLHDIRWTSIKILTKLLAYLEARKFDPARPERAGYQVVDLPTYLKEVEANPPKAKAKPAT